MLKNTDEQRNRRKEKEQRSDELVLANKELAFQNEEKDKRAEELILANEEKEKRANELVLANKELAYQNEEKDKRAEELILANEEKEKRANELTLANKELAFQNEEKDKRADELILANEEKEKRANELVLANKELAFQNEEKDKRADELTLANEEKEKRADELVLANKEKEKRADELILANKELAFQTELDGYRSEMERVAQDLTLLIDTANAPIFGIDAQGKVNEWNQQAHKITGFNKKEVMGRDLVADFIADEYKLSVGEVLAKALIGEETANFEFPLFTKSGDRVDVLLNSTTRRDASGKIVGVVGVGQDITKLNKVLVEQARISNDLTRLIDTANAPIFGIDADGKVNEWNQRAEKITGFNKKEVMGLDLVADFIKDDYKVSVGEVLEKALKGEETANFEFSLFTQSGDRVNVLLNSTTRRDAAGKTVGVVGVGQDITELNKVLVEQARISNDLTRLIDTANAPIFGIDADGRVNEWNQQAEKITGFNKKEVMGRDLVADFIKDNYKVSVGEVLEKALKGEETANFEFPLFTKSGSRVDVLLNSTTRRDASGKTVGVVGVGQDITELNKVLVEQERISNDLTQLIDTANAPIFGIDADGKVNEWNQQAEKITGFNKDEVMGRDLVADFIEDDYKASVGEILQKALKGEETASYEFPLFTQTGDRVDVLLNSTTRRDAFGKTVGVVGVGQDITERNRSQRALAESEAKEKRADELALANKELAFQNAEKDKRADELILANEEKEKRADELVLANKELAFQNEEKDKRANELTLANEEKDKRADELTLANEEKDKRADELTLANEEKEKRADELTLANKELAFQNAEKDKRADELTLANEEKEKRADELVLANKELAFQNEEKDKRADELTLANEEKQKRADELVLANKELAFQNEEKDKRADELILANKEKQKRAYELVLANKEKEKRADELILANKELAFQTELDGYRSEMERVAEDLTLLIDTANAPIFGIDAQGKVNEWNQQAEKITGFNKKEVMGRDLVADFITDDYKASVGEVLAKALKGEETANFEFPLFTKSGDRVDVLLNSTTRRDASGQIVGMVGVGQDITELNKVLVEQARISNDLTQLIDTANAPIFGIDADGKVNEWNQQAEKITGYNKKEVMGRDLVADFIKDDYKVSVGEVLEKALKGEETANFEFSLFAKSGDRVDVLLNSTTRRDAAGKTVGVVGVGQDITELNKVRVEQEIERKDAAAQIIQASKLATLGEMATSVAHELNQPLNIIRMAAGNSRRKMSKGDADPEYLNDKLLRIEEQTARAAAIIDHMRMFGREAKEYPEPVDPRDVVTNALDLMGEQFRLAGIQIVTELPGNCSFILGHTIQMEQVILNLLVNARDAMSENDGEARITLRVFEDDKGIHITSEDTGGGIPEDVLLRIFEPFFTTKKMGKGTGLGLSVSYGIVRDMNGGIVAENIDGGARFTITLPAVG
jgi:PAS domain S-box-containing protein